MSFTIGFPNASAITVGLKPATPAEDAALAVDDPSQDGVEAKEVKADSSAQGADGKSGSAGHENVVVQILLKRLQELQELLKQQQQQLVAAQAAPYPTPEAKTTAVMAIQGQIGNTNAAVQEVSAALVKELTKDSGAGAVINTTV
ncbi:hypothetical protein [Pseudomonas purpurea]|uniref:hypothetical protein n=1 Tax=Pseudomonas purpurea TaxID=3136737 RepID=UPI00326778B6